MTSSIKMNKIAIIGDLHGKYSKYLDIIKNYEYSIQVGDFGFNYRCLDQIDPLRHIFIPGNHDNYDALFHIPHYRGDFGQLFKLSESFNPFFIRGAFSIDGEYRRQAEMAGGPKTWWKEEELTRQQMELCVAQYEKTKPQLVVSHDCPLSISRRFSNSPILKNYGFDPETFQTNTGLLLEELFRIHQPRMWIFGHHHKHYDEVVNGCRFVCLRELEVLEIENIYTTDFF